jgi:hypothetical protein
MRPAKASLDFRGVLRHLSSVGLERSRPAYPKAFRPSTALCPRAGPRVFGEMFPFSSGPKLAAALETQCRT